jgi:uncharacterized protein
MQQRQESCLKRPAAPVTGPGGVEYEIRSAGQEQSPAFSEVLVATTWECNLACSYCFVEARSRASHRPIMSQGLAAWLVDALDDGLPDAETICIHLYGGEPLLNLPAIRGMLERTCQKPRGRFQFAITTNGTILDPEVFQLLEAGRFQVILSLDGPSHVHDSCRRTPAGQGTHHRLMQFLRTLRSRTGCRVRGSAVIRPGWTLAEAESYLRELGLDAIKAQAVRLPPDHPFALRQGEWAAYFDHLDLVGDQVIEDVEHGRMPRDDRFSSRVLQLLKGTSRTSYCAAGTTNFGVTPDGTVLPCVLLDAGDNALGRITDPPETWRSAGREWAASRMPDAACADCEAMPLCGGGCPAISPVCGRTECEVVRKNCEVARRIFDHFSDRPTALLVLAGIT